MRFNFDLVGDCVGIRQPTFIKFKENAKLNLISKKIHNIFNTLYWKICRLPGSQKMKSVAKKQVTVETALTSKTPPNLATKPPGGKVGGWLLAVVYKSK